MTERAVVRGHAAERWFRARGWTPFAFQRRTWSAYLAGESGLVQAPTGTGKSYAAWLGPVAEWLDAGNPPGGEAPPLTVLWITPLRALANDLASSLRRPLRDLGLPWTLELRTGDTPTRIKRRQRQRLPTALITTPESLSLMLSYPGAAEAFSSLRAVVVDEWHELLGSKRGVQAELGLARLRRLCPALRVWGLSATLGKPQQALDVLLGDGPRGRLIADRTPKPVELVTVCPAEIERFPWAGHLGLRLLPEVMLALEGARTTLLFTNTRSQAELWHRAIVRAEPEWEDRVALHHGSLDRELRTEVEQRLREGALRCAVCTSSLDLGVDFSPVDQVIQVGSPKGVGRLLQRAGRSGHRPGAVSRILCVPTHALELVEFAAARAALADGEIEPREPVRGALDVLAQHLVTLGAGDGFVPARLYDEVRTTHAFRDLDRRSWEWVLEFVHRGGRALGGYPQFRKLLEREGRMVAASEEIVRLHRASIGTITADVAAQVRYANGRKLGTIEETFVARLRPGDAFLFGGRLLELVRLDDAGAVVRRARKPRGTVPRWGGGRMPLSTCLGARVRAALAGAGPVASDELEAVRPMLELQATCSALPAAGELLVELLRVEGTFRLYLFPFEGRLVHEGLAALAAHRLIRRAPATVVATVNDYGIELGSTTDFELDAGRIRALLDPARLLDDLLACLDASGLARRRFREIARIGGLIAQGFPGNRRSARQLQTSSELLFDVFRRFDPRNLLLRQARREVMEQQLELSRLRGALERMRTARLRLVRPGQLTPLAFPLWAEGLQAQQLSSERWEDRVQRMALRLERSAARGGRRAS